MKKQYEYLNDEAFLKAIDYANLKQTYIKITVLDWKENPIQDIEGKVLSGSISLNGQSSLRRTGSLNILADETINNIQSVNNLLSINKKIFIQVGIKNTTIINTPNTNLFTSYTILTDLTDNNIQKASQVQQGRLIFEDYSESSQRYKSYQILYFPLGLFVITSLSISNSLDNLTISMQINDKMCLLNGTCGGIIHSSVVFDNYDTIDQHGNLINTRPTIYQIIQQLVNHFGNEDLSRIVISDLDTRVKQVMKWTGSTPLYFLKKEGSNYKTTMSGKAYQQALDDGYVNIMGSPFEYGYDVGYTYTDFTYPGDLIGNAGDTVTSVLDNIINILGNYEYFYDIWGNFHFQEIKNYLNNSQTKYIIDAAGTSIPVPDYLADLRNIGQINSNDYLLNNSKGKTVYQFEDSKIIDNYNNSPQYNNIKNDYMVWGIRKTSTGMQLPIRYHLAIDKKPKTGNSYQVFKYEDPEDGLTKYHAPIKFNNFNSFPEEGTYGVFYLANDTGYIYKWGIQNNKNQYIKLDTQIITVITQDWRTELYFQGVSAEPYGIASNYYYTELQNEWPKLYEIVQVNDHYEDKLKDEVIKKPEMVDFYLDLIDTTSKIHEFEVDNIGRRTKVLNEGNSVNCIFEPQIPDIILIPTTGSGDDTTITGKMRKQAEDRNQTWVQVSDTIYDCLVNGGSFNSAYQTIRQLLHQYTSYCQSISISCMPIYHLEPNTRIFVRDNETGIYGDYMIDNISINLDTSSMMTISCNRALERI